MTYRSPHGSRSLEVSHARSLATGDKYLEIVKKKRKNLKVVLVGHKTDGQGPGTWTKPTLNHIV